MKLNAQTYLLFLAISGIAACTSTQPKEETMETPTIAPPTAKKVAKELTIHNDTRTDNYYWLKDRENQEVIDYLTAENDYLDKKLAHTKDFQEKLFEEMTGRIKQDDESVPYLSNGYYYYTRFEEGGEYPIFCRRKGSLEADEEIMLNVNQMAEGFEYYQVGGINVSPDNKLLAFSVDTVSRRLYTIHVKNLETGEMLTESIANTSGGVAWANDNNTFFYTAKDLQTLRTDKVYRHKLGNDSSKDEMVFQEMDDTFISFCYRSKSGKFILIGSYQTVSSEYQMLSADDPDGDFQVIQARERDHEYDLYHHGDFFYVRTNWEAKNFRLMRTKINAPSKENWEEVIAHREDVLLEDLEIFNDYLVVDERKNGLAQLRIMNQKDGSEHYLDFGEPTYTAYVSVNREPDTDMLRFGYTSLTTPNSTFDYNMGTKEKTLMKEQPILGDFDKANYASERLYATAEDGTQVPISLVYRKDQKKAEGGNPVFLAGYGSYGSSYDPYFSIARLSLLDRGFIYAIAHVRGGEDLGRDWYENGKLLKKKNTFTDFISCGEHLVTKGYTSKDQLFAWGGSAGGLLMGAIINMRPDLWKGVIAAVPFVDVVTTMLDESIPLTTGEYDEWGNPNEKEYYDYIKSYSPYDNVSAQNYPNLLVTTGLHDSQVQYWEPAKWVAKLREMKTGDNDLYLYTNMDAGHGGASGRFKQYHETALEYAFIFDLMGIVE